MLDALLKRKLSKEQQEKVDFLSNVRLFEGLSVAQKAEFIPYLYERHYSENEVVFFRSDASHAIYIVKSGQVELSLDIGMDNDECFYQCPLYYTIGINSILNDQKRDFDATVVSEKAELIVISKSDFNQVLNKNKDIKIRVLENFAGIYEELISKIFKVYKNNVGFFELKNVFKEN